jgi:exopolysaccharide biosynthesis polyprenyl glycosylphosphotransferase
LSLSSGALPREPPALGSDPGPDERDRDARPLVPAGDGDVLSLWEAAGRRLGAGPRRDAILRRWLGVSDAIASLLALLICVTIVGRGQVSLRPACLLVVPLIVVAAKIIGLYDRDQHSLRTSTIDEVPSLTYLAVLFALMVWLGEHFVVHGYLGRPEVFALTVIGFGLFVCGRVIVRAAVGALVSPERCIVVGGAEDKARIEAKLAGAAGANAIIVGWVPHGAGDATDADRSAAALSPRDDASLPELIVARRADRVIIAPGGSVEDDLLHSIRLIKAIGIKVSVLPRLLEVIGSSSTFEDLDGLSMLGVRGFAASRSSQSLKRAMDIVGATIGLILLAPLMCALALAVLLDTGLPVLFRQERIGRHGERFAMLKFRSMVIGADAMKPALSHRNEAEGGLFKIADDPRVTRAGRFLRATSLDELPQLFNVLAGSMSLVGPRPLVPEEDALIEGWQRRRLGVKPGMTGLWQIFGSARIPMHEMVEIDYLYGANWSLWLDLKILLRTVPYVVRRRGL